MHRRMVGLLVTVLLLAGGLPTMPTARAAHAAAPQDVPGNVVPDSSFEQQGQGWQSCGGVQFADTQANLPDTPLRVHGGRYAARIGGPTISEGDQACPLQAGAIIVFPSQLLRVPVNIPANATELTVSFWYSSVGPSPIPVDVFFADRINYPYGLEFPTDPELGFMLSKLSASENVGWYEYRQVLRGDDLADARNTSDDYAAGRPASGNTFLNFRILSRYAADDPASTFIDDVAVTFSDRSMPLSPLPTALAGDGTQPIVYMHAIPGEGTFGIYRMDSDGAQSQMIYRSRLSYATKPRWSPDGQRLVTIEAGLRGLNPDDPTVNPAREDELTILNANGQPLSAPARGRGGRAGRPARLYWRA